jgi:hypothetical protein
MCVFVERCFLLKKIVRLSLSWQITAFLTFLHHALQISCQKSILFEFSGKFSEAAHWSTTPSYIFWHALYADSCLSKIGEVLSPLPASAARVERVWSTASFITAERERLSAEHLREEVYSFATVIISSLDLPPFHSSLYALVVFLFPSSDFTNGVERKFGRRIGQTWNSSSPIVMQGL